MLLLILVAVLLYLLFQGVPSFIISPSTASSTYPTTGPGAPPIHVTLTPSQAGIYERLTFVSTVPVPVSFTATSGWINYLWTFGDGTNSTSQAVVHVFQPNCVYEIELKASTNGGPASKGYILFSIFTYNRPGGLIISCPSQGTAGITNVEIAGAFYPFSSQLVTLVNGQNLANVTVDSKGNWGLNVTDMLPPAVDGTVYNFTTAPKTFRGIFLSLEGIKATPTKGLPGTSVTLIGRSYPALTTVAISLGGVSLGDAQTDENGSFTANLVIPTSFHYAGTYQFTTSPAVLGAQAYFKIPVSSATPLPPSIPFWPWILAAPAAAAILLVVFLLRRRRPVDLEVFQQQLAKPFASAWAVRVWAKKDIGNCTVTYDGAPLQSVVSPTEAKPGGALAKGNSMDFHIPSSMAILEDAWVVVRDGEKTLRSEKFGSIPHAKS